ncbi:hypothetical protein M9Y10_009448 [Tritrichomonas musculus]|uniref:Uncharacterized protein n=1 Tax=Tritrichomonas musculus TaxID=1915356 RepID=A0ABR2IPR8_9EUKA
MRTGYALQSANRETKPSSDETALIRSVIRDEYTNAISEWVVKQKPKLRTKFIRFLSAVHDTPIPSSYSSVSSDVAERFARDIFSHKYHPVLRNVIDESGGEFSDVIHLLSIHMSRSNVMASITQKRDETPKLLKAIAQEDHILSRPYQARHELPQATAAPPLTRSRMVEQQTACVPTRTCKPARERTTPFATFPSSEPMESTYRSEFPNYDGKYQRTQQSGVCNVLNAPTCL